MKKYKKNKEYNTSKYLVYKCHYHVIFCPKYRHKILAGNVKERLKQLTNEIAKTYDFEIIEIETDENHMHILISCNPRFGITECVQRIKSITAKKLYKEFPRIRQYYLWGGQFWSRSTFISTVGSVSLEIVKKYIENQGK